MRTLWKNISAPFKWSWYLLNFIRDFILNIFFVIVIIMTVWVCLQLKYSALAPEKSALIMDLAGTVVDKPAMHHTFPKIGRALFGVSRKRLQENSLFDIVNTLRQAKNDSNITGLVLSLKDFLGTDQASLQYIGKALREFRDSGKPIYAVGNSYSQAQYFLATYANRIFLTPQGAVDLRGFATNHLYYTTYKKL